jgi:uncharacterized protein (TIGR03067 family)
VNAETEAELIEKEKEALKGAWGFVQGRNYKFVERVPGTLKIEIEWTITDDKIVVTSETGKRVEMTYKADPSRRPRTIDFTMMMDGKKETMLGIYSLERDLLQVCYGKDRPTELAAAPRSQTTSVALVRKKLWTRNTLRSASRLAAKIPKNARPSARTI